MQFSLKWLLAAVAFVAVCLVAMLNANESWGLGLRSAVLLSVLVAGAGALWSAGETRTFCGGYALFAIPFLAVFFGFKSRSDFVSAHLLETIHANAFSPATETIRGSFYPATHDGDVLTVVHQKDASLLVTAIRPKRQEFVSVGHSVISVMFCVLGGLVASAFRRRRAVTLSP